METLEYRILLSAAPLVSTLPAHSISPTGATLNGTVNPEDSTATARFQYSTSPTFTPTVLKTIGSGTGFSHPSGVAVDAVGDVFVAQSGSASIKEILPGSIKSIGSGFESVRGVAVNAAGDVFVADYGHNAVKEILPNGTIKTIGTGFSTLQGIAADAAGDVFVADSGRAMVSEFLLNGSVKTIGSGYMYPVGVALDAAGDVFVADEGTCTVDEILTNGHMKTIGPGFNGPTSVALDGAGDVFVTDRISSTGTALKEVLPNGSTTILSTAYSGADSLAFAAGSLFVADNGHNRVVELSPPTLGAKPSPLSGSTATTVSGNLTGLTPDTIYYYRLVATNAGGTVEGKTAEFATVSKLAIGGPAVTYTPGGAAIAVAPAATLSNGDAGFAKASLSVVDTTFASYRSDRLSIRSSGSLVVSGTSLVYGGVTIGSFTGGSNGTVSITFNSSATEAGVLAVVQNVIFSSANPAATVANRSIKFQLTDGAGNHSAPITQTIKFA